ncbi:MAG: 50S ribosomal protein L11 methyltransferase [Clostridia bacterium]|nr:50S ribosomal protein L11 methyltransferase [Clostridia bacterium]
MDYIKMTIETTTEGSEVVAEAISHVCPFCQIDDPHDTEEFANSPSPRWDYLGEELFEHMDRPVTVSVYLEHGEESELAAAEVAAAVASLAARNADAALGTLRVSREEVRSEDWEHNWKKFYKPFCVGERLLVRPSWEEVSEIGERAVLVIDPASSFGTGSHATTRMCLEEIEAGAFDGANVLDAGSGSGILTAAALLLGARHAIACDIEENAARTTAENLLSNGVSQDRFAVYAGDFLTNTRLRETLAAGAPYRLITANIVADVLIAMAPALAAWLAEDGTLLLSGIILSREQEVAQAFAAQELIIETARELDGWRMFAMKKRNF